MESHIHDAHYPRGWHYDPSAPSWRTEQSMLALIATAVAAFPANAGLWTILFAAGFIASLIGSDSRWHTNSGAVFVTAAFASVCFLWSASLAISEALWFGSWPLSLVMLTGLSLAWMGPALAEATASWQYLTERRRKSPAWLDLFRDEHDNVA